MLACSRSIFLDECLDSADQLRKAACWHTGEMGGPKEWLQRATNFGWLMAEKLAHLVRQVSF